MARGLALSPEHWEGGLGFVRADLICASGMFLWLQREGRPAGRWEQEGCEDLRTPGQGFWEVGGGKRIQQGKSESARVSQPQGHQV